MVVVEKYVIIYFVLKIFYVKKSMKMPQMKLYLKI